MAWREGMVQWMRIPALPKQEYYLGRELCKKYGMEDDNGNPNWKELFTVLLRLTYEIDHLDTELSGEQWIKYIINTLRSNPSEMREYQLK